eukprot:CAMPEP_0196572528 /NCGR_PEP_ID=MMETSP1081-20130531/2571_1 /TAXON_ID=36882 /ORGANISM="Pyramimonas amylifera, Strain CCMP720" /LENGTH=160 /DNA_ID=CAMNT_0041889883 /DNA_START=84 /DNA_END=563 /DNA_ORIENTATION=+
MKESWKISATSAAVSCAATVGVMRALPHRLPSKGNETSKSIEVDRSKTFSSNFTVQALSHKVTREDLGRSTWTLLHTIAAAFPDTPTRQQRKDAKIFVESLARIYPCAECSKHFQIIVKDNPVEAETGEKLSQYMCRLHNVVNRGIKKPIFNCDKVEARW